MTRVAIWTLLFFFFFIEEYFRMKAVIGEYFFYTFSWKSFWDPNINAYIFLPTTLTLRHKYDNLIPVNQLKMITKDGSGVATEVSYWTSSLEWMWLQAGHLTDLWYLKTDAGKLFSVWKQGRKTLHQVAKAQMKWKLDT